MFRCISYFDERGFLIWILIVFLFKFVFTLNKGKDNIFCATTKQTGGTEWHGGHWLRKVSGNGKTTKFLEYGKCLETGKRQNPLNTESVQKQGNNKIPWIRKVSGNRKTTKSFESAKTSLTRGAERPFRCLDRTGKTSKSLEYEKCLKTGKTSKSLDYGNCLETGKTAKSH